jgi:secreted trypsin-like serine protease
MRSLKVLGGVATVAASLAMAAPPAAAVTGGSADDSHPYVVAVIPWGAGRPTCSGVWSAVRSGATLVLTDAHCVPARRGDEVRVFFGSRWTVGAQTYVGRSFRNPAYNAKNHADDVAVIRLSSHPAVLSARLASRGSATGQDQVTTVGYGTPNAGSRREASEMVTARSAARLYLRPGSGNSCEGDSGGPDLIPNQRQVVALTDDGSCSDDADTRLDTVAMERFLNSF